ncbi:MAG: glycosyltransferase family 2 protein [Alphaproteobacteria bacterium]
MSVPDRHSSASPARSSGPPPRVSVIVPVRDDAARLRHCLEALRAQTVPPFEVIVVDNGSTDESAEVARSFGGVDVICEPRPGSYAARNAGLHRAEGEFVAFTDSDCIPAPGWLANLLAAAAGRGGFGIIAGHVEFFKADERAGDACFHHERLFLMNQRANARHGRCVTANWLSRAETLRAFGGFDAALQSGGDFELSGRISAAGMEVIYAPEAVVRHPARRSAGEIAVKTRRITAGLWAFTPLRPRLPALSAMHTVLMMRRIGTALSAPGLTAAQRLKVSGLIVFVWAVALGRLVRLQSGGGDAGIPEKGGASGYAMTGAGEAGFAVTRPPGDDRGEAQ